MDSDLTLIDHPQLRNASSRCDSQNNQPYVLVEDLDEGKIRIIKINRVKAKNSFDDWLYLALADALNIASQNETVLVVILTGAGEYFSSGADLRAGLRTEDRHLKLKKGETFDPVGVFMRTLVRFPKPLIAAVNGPAIGVGCSMLPHADVVYASDTSYFYTPFSRIAVAPELGSSVTFPRVLGPSVANDMLLFAKTISVQHAHAIGFVARVFPTQNFLLQVIQEVRSSLDFPLLERTLPLFKNMIRKWDAEFMDKLVVDELIEIDKREERGDIAQAVKAFMGTPKPKASRL